MTLDQETFVGFRQWWMDSSPTFGVTARIIWRPVAVCAWEAMIGERGLCSLPVFTRAEEAKQDAWNVLWEGMGKGKRPFFHEEVNAISSDETPPWEEPTEE